MDSIHPWLDADELKQLAESLMHGDRKPPARPDQDPAFGDGFVGFTGKPNVTPPASSIAPPQQSTPSMPAPIPAPQQSKPSASPAPAAPTPETSPLPPMATPSPATPQPAPAAMPEEEAAAASPTPPAAATHSPRTPTGAEAQCQDLQTRLGESFGAEQIFILNRDGHTVFGKDHLPHLQFMARSLTRDAERRGLPKGHIHVKVGPDQVLEIIPISLPNGGWVVGTVVPRPLRPEDIQVWVKEVSKLSSSLNQL